MKRINATLPTLGAVPVDFHKESEEVYNYLGDRELRRLRQVPHLGLAGAVFTGVSHSRLEYLLLQCAVIGLVAKLHKDHEVFALASTITLNGLSTPFSSGQELLKCWALLANSGHAQYTYGIERSVLQEARRNEPFLDWLVHAIGPADILKWSRSAIANYRDEEMHFVLALARLRHQLASRDRRKARFTHYLRNLLLPVTDLFPSDRTAQYKLARLRFLFSRVRLLSMVALDSYYSHHSIRIDLSSAINSLADITSISGRDKGFEQLLFATAGWLADEIYLHPTAVATQREYEIRLSRILPRRFERAAKRRRGYRAFFNNLLFNGFGRGSPNALVPLIRLTFDSPRLGLLPNRDLFSTMGDLQEELGSLPTTVVSLDRNRFSGMLHIDVLADRILASFDDSVAVFVRLRRWLTRQLEATALDSVRAAIPQPLRTNEAFVERRRQAALKLRLEQEAGTIRRIFESVIRLVLPDGRTGDISEVMPGSDARESILVRLTDSKGVVYDQIGEAIDHHLTVNPRRYGGDRLQEVEGLKALLAHSRAPFVIACTEKYLVRNELGKTIDDWDGVMLEIGEADVVLTILEAKNLGSRVRNENEAFKQLRATKTLLCSATRLFARRQRFRGLGATLTCTLREITPRGSAL